MLRACSFLTLFCALSSSNRSQASIFSCFKRTRAACCAALLRRYSLFLSAFLARSRASCSICLLLFSKYAFSAFFTRSARAAILASRLACICASASLLADCSAACAASASLLCRLASSSLCCLASFLALASSMMPWTFCVSRDQRSACRAWIRSSRLRSLSWCRLVRSLRRCFCISACSLLSARSSSIRCLRTDCFSSSSFRFSCNSATKALRLRSCLRSALAALLASSRSASLHCCIRSA
mmetsp:Transcript_56048/g.175894  ORF Transcript_56048/g.175894 Transcript_56048/m.175894 type:complete len:241 (-) Transcript_56048:405-1127(-)